MLLRMAAVLVLVTIGSVLALQLMPERVVQDRQADYQVFKTHRGERSTIRLADGSTVTLNADSRLTVPASFGESDRTLYLEGQGYFEVADRSGQAFTVETELATVRVTGTEFDVDSYPGTGHVQVVVATGEVWVRSADDATPDSIVLKPRDVGLVFGAGEKVVRRSVDVHRYLAWREGRLLFDNASFENVARNLERWYELDVDTRRVPDSVDGLTASFNSEPVEEVLDVISMALNLTYQKDGNQVVFYPARRGDHLTRHGSDQ